MNKTALHIPARQQGKTEAWLLALRECLLRVAPKGIPENPITTFVDGVIVSLE